MATIGDVVRARRATSGFDYMRLALAVAVIAVHAVRVTRGPEALETLPAPVGALINMILVMFFGLSGFLVAGSLERVRSLKVFLTFRALRIFPALTVEVVLSALLLGPLLTTLPVGTYFAAPEFVRYLANALGIVSFELPGVFEPNLVPEVNGSLWTVPYELECYVALALLALLTVTRRPGLLALGVLGYGVFLCTTTIFDVDLAPRLQVTMRDAGDLDVALSYLLVPSFLAGVSIYFLRDRLPHDARLGAAAGAIALLCVASPYLYGVAVLPAAYMTAMLGLANPPRHKLIRLGDYSYGIYLYAYPVQQTIWQVTEFGKAPLGNFAASLVLVGLFAAFSWHAIEKPSLGLKRVIFDRQPTRGSAAA